MVPDLIISSHPFRCWSIIWSKAIVPNSVRLPGYMAELDRIDRCMEIVVVDNWCGVLMGEERGIPDTEKLVNGVV